VHHNRHQEEFDMALVRWEPARELHTIQSEMNRLFDTFFGTPGNGGTNPQVRRWVPAMDLVETDDHFVLRADLPGLAEGDVKIEVADNVLTVSGERRFEHEGRKDGFYRLERGSGSFARSLTLPEGVDEGAIDASFDKGVLEVRIPKPAERKPRRVEIAVGGERPTIEGKAAEAAPHN
jgi:HSP20 family protein